MKNGARILSAVLLTVLVAVLPAVAQEATPAAVAEQYGRFMSDGELLLRPQAATVITTVGEWSEFRVIDDSEERDGELWFRVTMLSGAEGTGWTRGDNVEFALPDSTDDVRCYLDGTCMSAPVDIRRFGPIWEILREEPYHFEMVFPEGIEFLDIRPFTLLFEGESYDEVGVDAVANRLLLPDTFVATHPRSFNDEWRWQIVWDRPDPEG